MGGTSGISGNWAMDLFRSEPLPVPAAASAATLTVLRLYVASTAPNSMKALANLEAICRAYLKGAYTLEIVDVLVNPERARADGVMVTPSLAKLSPLPTVRIVGNLNDHDEVRAALGIRASSL